ncbi:MAG TPA: HAD family hydrolase [Bacillota bacterium]|mgnify:CR=1 FL=1|nr:HAD family hydrolase [Bacillota bacterium]HPT87460.1 HAD family hydrolase [Bacillota bacterium]
MSTLTYRCDDPVSHYGPSPWKRPAVFFDRDGTLIEEHHYLNSISDIRILPGVLQGLRKLKFTGWPLYIITNQAGVAHGYFSEKQLAEIHQYLLHIFERHHIHFQGLFYCPHHPKSENSVYQRDCFGRKPKPGLILKAAEIDNLDLANSYVIGDKLIDIQAGKAGGTKTILILTGYGRNERLQITEFNHPDFIAGDFIQAVNWILKDWNQSRHRIFIEENQSNYKRSGTI